jgi:hypothetical protein
MKGDKETITLSITSKILKELREESESKDTSLNSNVNSVLTKYVTFYRHAEAIGCFIMPLEIFMSFVELLDEDKVVEILGFHGENAILSFFHNNNISMSEENLLKYGYGGIGLWTGQYSSFRQYPDTDDNNTVIVLDHKGGIKWSNILARLHANWIEHLLDCPVKILNVTPRTVAIKILQNNKD